MLQNIRNNTQGIVAKIIIGLIVISFAFFGVESLLSNNSANNVALVNGEELSVDELNQAINLQRRQLLNRMGENADLSLLDDNLLRNSALEQLIQQRLLIQAADDAAIAIGSSALDQTIVSMPQFQQDGVFSPQLYQNILRSNGYSPGNFKRILSQDLVISQLNQGMGNSNFITDHELAQTAQMVGQLRSFRYFILPIATVAEQVTIDEAQIAEYYAQNLAAFQTEDRVKVAYIEIKRADFFKPVTEEALATAYQIEQQSYEGSEERRGAHLLIEINDQRSEQQAEALITELAQKLAQGESFAQLVTDYSDDTLSAAQAGDVGFSTGDSFPEAFDEALFALALDQVSAPVLTEAGYHLIIATEINSSAPPSFAERRTALELQLQGRAAETAFVATVEELRNLVFNSEDLAGPAAELDLTVSHADWLSQRNAAGVLAERAVLAALFSSDVLTDGNNSEVIELAADHFVVARVQEYDAAHDKPLSDVSDRVKAQLSRQQTTALALQQADAAMIELAQGQSIEALALAQDYQWQIVSKVKRNALTVERQLLSGAFDMQLSGNEMALEKVQMANGDIAVVQLEHVQEGLLSDLSSAERRGIKAELQRGAVDRSISSFIVSLRDKATIDLY